MEAQIPPRTFCGEFECSPFVCGLLLSLEKPTCEIRWRLEIAPQLECGCVVAIVCVCPVMTWRLVHLPDCVLPQQLVKAVEHNKKYKFVF